MPTTSRKLWNPDDLDRMRSESDRLGDEVVATFGDDTALVASLLDSLVSTEQATAETSETLRSYRERTRHLPPWADRVKIERAQRLLSTNLVPGTIFLAAASLPQCYLDHRGAPVLTATHQLTSHVFRRLIQTSHMVFTVYDPGSLFPDPRDPEAIPAGIHKAQTVRLMHALMRHLLLTPVPSDAGPPRSPSDTLLQTPWDRAALGKPINQEDEAFVLLTFSYVTIEGFARVALVLTDEDKDAIVHLWSVVGYVMGIHEGLLAHSYDDAAVLFALFRARLRGPSEDGQALTRALVDWINGLLPSWLRWFDAGTELIWFFNGPQDAEMLGVGPTGTDRIIHAIIANLLPPYEEVARRAGRPHPVERLVNYLAQKMVVAVWEAAENDVRRIDWPEHVRIAAGR